MTENIIFVMYFQLLFFATLIKNIYSECICRG